MLDHLLIFVQLVLLQVRRQGHGRRQVECLALMTLDLQHGTSDYIATYKYRSYPNMRSSAPLHAAGHAMPCYDVDAHYHSKALSSSAQHCCAVMLCYAMLCYAMLCYAMLCCAVLCCAVLCCAVLCYATRRPMLRYAMLCYDVLCRALPWHIA